jgi:DNA-binding response OmpR family regulator
MADVKTHPLPAVLLLLAPAPAAPGGVFLGLSSQDGTQTVPVAANQELLQLASRLLQAAQAWLGPDADSGVIAPALAPVHRAEPGSAPRQLKAGPFQVDGPHRLVRWRGPKGWRSIDLTDIERRLLCQLLASAGRVCSRSDIAAGVWGSEAHNLRTVDQCVRRLRRSMVAAGVPDCIKTVRGVGYRLVPAVARPDGHPGAHEVN